MNQNFDNIIKKINNIDKYIVQGKIVSINGTLIRCSGIYEYVKIGTQCNIINNENNILCEVIAINNKIVSLMSFYDIQDIGLNSKVYVKPNQLCFYPSEKWKGRVINALCEPIDDLGELSSGNKVCTYKSKPVSFQDRDKIGKKIDLGIKAINSFVTCCDGQRLGIFAGSGIGKSSLLAMITKFAEADVKIIGLIGERGREAKEFIDEYLGEEGLKNAIVIVSTSEESALMRIYASYLTMALSEYFSSIGKSVICLMDSVTRFAMAQREIGLALNEIPVNKGYTPSVFSEIPKLLERAGPKNNKLGFKNITGIFTVLVEGDDHNEPISDTVRGTLDGHIILDRKIAEQGRYPAINILKSISRAMPKCNSDQENQTINKIKKMLAIASDIEDMVKLGAYKAGSNKEIDLAIRYQKKINDFLSQNYNEHFNFEYCFNELSKIIETIND